jgi:hypothetical protein
MKTASSLRCMSTVSNHLSEEVRLDTQAEPSPEGAVGDSPGRKSGVGVENDRVP